MGVLVSQNWKREVLAGSRDLEGTQWWCILLMTNTTADTEANASHLATYTDLDEIAAVSRRALSGASLSRDDANGRVEWDFASSPEWLALANSTRPLQGIYYYWDDDADGDPADDSLGHNQAGVFAEFAQPINHDGSDFEVSFDAEGALWLF